jgi:hypothetical protein
MADLEVPVGYGLWQFTMVHATIAHAAVSTVGFKVATPPYTQGQLASALAAFALAVKPMHDAEVTYSKAVALVGNDGPPLRYEATGVVVGTRTAGVISPPNVTYLIKKSTAYAGRRYRGRMYLPFVQSLGVTQTGQLTGPEQTLLVTSAAALFSGLVAAGPNASELSLLHAESALSATPAPTPVAALLASSIVATQRRRLERT